MKYGYYPGCSLHATAIEYDRSFTAVCEKLGLELVEVEDWVCCGTTPAHSTSHLLATALPAQSLVNAGKSDLDQVVVPCASCFQRLMTAVSDLEEDEDLRGKVEKVLEAPVPDGMTVSHPLETFLENPGPAELKRKVEKPLEGLSVACYYGCLLTRPPKVMKFDDAENPQFMDKILAACGAKVPDWSMKTECCGAAFSLTKKDVVLELTNRLFANAKAVGANVIAVACPLCHANLDMRQEEIEAKFDTKYDLPVLYFTQLMGLALGLSGKDLGLDGHMVDPWPLLEEKELS